MNIETKYDKELRYKILELLEEVVGVPREYWEVKRTKEADEVLIRQIYCYLLSEYTDFNLQKIANILGFKYHTSVMRTIVIVKEWQAINSSNHKGNHMINQFKEAYEKRHSSIIDISA